jgi:hypothetical protein
MICTALCGRDDSFIEVGKSIGPRRPSARQQKGRPWLVAECLSSFLFPFH